jgi:hypothetical protein
VEEGRSLRNVYFYNLALLLLSGSYFLSAATSPLDVEYSIMDHFYLLLRASQTVQNAWGSRKIILLRLGRSVCFKSVGL